MTLHATPKPMGKKPLVDAKPADDKELVSVATGNGNDRCSKVTEFEEFQRM